MIHIVIGGSLSGKTTFVRKTWLKKKGVSDKLMGVPITSHGPTCVIGDYNKKIRTCGVDQMGRDYDKIRALLLALLSRHESSYVDFVMEGNAVADFRFLDELKERGFQTKVKLWMMDTPAKVVAARYKKLGLNYGHSIMVLSYKRGIKIWEAYKGDFEHEMVAG